MTVQELESAIAEAAQRLGPAVVGLRRGWGGGCGVVFAPGKVLTNAHNLRDDELTLTFADGRSEAGGRGVVPAAMGGRYRIKPLGRAEGPRL